MSTVEATIKPRKSIAIMVVRTIVGLAFATFGMVKLIGVAQMVAEFDVIGFGQGFRYLTGAIEVIGAVLLLWPARSVLGALLLLAVSVGALLTQLFILHGDPIHTLVLAALTGWLAWAQRPRSRGIDRGEAAP